MFERKARLAELELLPDAHYRARVREKGGHRTMIYRMKCVPPQATRDVCVKTHEPGGSFGDLFPWETLLSEDGKEIRVYTQDPKVKVDAFSQFGHETFIEGQDYLITIEKAGSHLHTFYGFRNLFEGIICEAAFYVNAGGQYQGYNEEEWAQQLHRRQWKDHVFYMRAVQEIAIEERHKEQIARHEEDEKLRGGNRKEMGSWLGGMAGLGGGG